MFDTHVTVVGNVVAEPRLAHTKDGHPVASFRLASTPRRLDRVTGEWRDGETLFIGVTCWRALAENVVISLKKGSSVIVMGKLSIRPYETKDGDKRQSVDIDARAVGPDLGRAVAVIKRTERGLPMNSVERSASDFGQPEDPEESEDGEPGTAYPSAAASTAVLPEHEWGWKSQRRSGQSRGWRQGGRRGRTRCGRRGSGYRGSGYRASSYRASSYRASSYRASNRRAASCRGCRRGRRPLAPRRELAPLPMITKGWPALGCETLRDHEWGEMSSQSCGLAMSTGSTGIQGVCDSRCMTSRASMPTLRLVARLHVDLLRVSSAACLPAA